MDIEQEIKQLDSILELGWPKKEGVYEINFNIAIRVKKEDLEDIIREGADEWQWKPHPLCFKDLKTYMENTLCKIRVPAWGEKIVFAEVVEARN